MSFTPGPWEIIGHSDDDECRIRQTESVKHGKGFYSEITICEQINRMGNAHLIAAAPELLEALELAAETLRRYEGYHRAKQTQESLDKAIANQQLAMRFEAVIAKARGEGV